MADRPAGAFLFRYSQTEPDKLSLTYSAAASSASSSASGSLRPKHCLVYNLGAAGFGLSANSVTSSTGTDKGSSNVSSSSNGAFENIAAFVAAHSGSRLSVAVASELSLQFQAEVQQEAKALKIEEEAAAATAIGSDISEVDNPVEGGSAEAWSLYGSADLLMGRSTSKSPHQQRKSHNKPLSLSGCVSSPLLLSPSSWISESATAAQESMLATKSRPWSGSDNESSRLKPLPLLPSPQEPAVNDAFSKPPTLGALDRQVSASTANGMMVAELANDEREIAVEQVVI